MNELGDLNLLERRVHIAVIDFAICLECDCHILRHDVAFGDPIEMEVVVEGIVADGDEIVRGSDFDVRSDIGLGEVVFDIRVEQFDDIAVKYWFAENEVAVAFGYSRAVVLFRLGQIIDIDHLRGDFQRTVVPVNLVVRVVVKVEFVIDDGARIETALEIAAAGEHFLFLDDVRVVFKGDIEVVTGNESVWIIGITFNRFSFLIYIVWGVAEIIAIFDRVGLDGHGEHALRNGKGTVDCMDVIIISDGNAVRIEYLDRYIDGVFIRILIVLDIAAFRSVDVQFRRNRAFG